MKQISTRLILHTCFLIALNVRQFKTIIVIQYAVITKADKIDNFESTVSVNVHFLSKYSILFHPDASSTANITEGIQDESNIKVVVVHFLEK